MNTKAVCYSHPAGPNATKFGFDKEGCFTVHIINSADCTMYAKIGFKTKEEAFDFADNDEEFKNLSYDQYSIFGTTGIGRYKNLF